MTEKIYQKLLSQYAPLDDERQYKFLEETAKMITDLNITSLFGRPKWQTKWYRENLGLYNNGKSKSINTIKQEQNVSKRQVTIRILQMRRLQHEHIIQQLTPYYINNYRLNKIDPQSLMDTNIYNRSILNLTSIETLEDLLCHTKQEYWKKIIAAIGNTVTIPNKFFNELCDLLHSLNLEFIDELELDAPLREYLLTERKIKQLKSENIELMKMINEYTSLEKELESIIAEDPNSNDYEKLKEYFKQDIRKCNEKELREKLLVIKAIKVELESLHQKNCLRVIECYKNKDRIAEEQRQINKTTAPKKRKLISSPNGTGNI